MKRFATVFVAFTILVGLFSIPAGRAYAQEAGSGSVDVIIQTDGSTGALVDYIQSVGGTVKIQYRNIPAVAASLPAASLGEVAQLAGVTRVQKDKLMYLADSGGPKGDTEPTSFTVQDTRGIKVRAVEPSALRPKVEMKGYASFVYTGAEQIWEETDFGEGSVVAVVDTGTAPNVCLAHAVIGAPGYPDGYNATGDGIPATDPSNYWHGTHVGGVIASACALDFSGAEDDPLWQAIHAYLPWPIDFVPIFGQAPMAQIYPVKVFQQDGSPTPNSVVLDGLDHVLSLKRDGLLDIDVVNLSLGGPTMKDEGDAYDAMLKEFYKSQIFVVSAAGNEGPIPNSVGSPASTKVSLSVGALDYAPSSRVLYEYLGLINGLPAGQGLVMRPTDEVRVTNFSSRGPLSTGHTGVDLAAPGLWNVQFGPLNDLRWPGGTSFSAATVSGVAALLNAYKEGRAGRDVGVYNLRAALLLGADAEVVGEPWRDTNVQGFGAVNAVSALQHLADGDLAMQYPVWTGNLQPNILGPAVQGQTESFASDEITLNPSETFEAVFRINAWTSKVTIEIFDIVAPDNSAYAFWPNALEVHVQDARRTAVKHPVATYWYPYIDGDSFTIEIEDGPWTLDGSPWTYAPMQPGLMKISLAGDYTNESPFSFKMRVVRENYKPAPTGLIAQGDILMGDEFLIPVEIPAGVSKATFDLLFRQNWAKFPTSDIDMLVFDPEFKLVGVDGDTYNAPERSIISDPMAGTWYVYVYAYELYKPDYYKLFMNLDLGEPYPVP